MNFIAEYFLSGQAFFAGCLMLILATFLSIKHKKLVFRLIFGILFFIGMAFIIFSGVPVPVFLFSLMAVSMAALYFFLPFEANTTRLFFWGARGILLISVLFLFIREMNSMRMPEIKKADHKKMYVIGTSFSLCDKEPSYVDLIRDKYHINAFNLSEAGNTAKKAMAQAELISSSDIVVVIELGLDDEYENFNVYLEDLLKQLTGQNRTIVMFELPVLSGDGNYCQIQRDLAKKYNVKLIPKRVLARSVYYWSNGSKHHMPAAGHKWLARKIGPYLAVAFKDKPKVKKKQPLKAKSPAPGK